MIAGSCKKCWRCQVCGEVYGGVAEGSVRKVCQWCGHRGLCSPEVYWGFCGSYKCVVEVVLNLKLPPGIGDYSDD